MLLFIIFSMNLSATEQEWDKFIYEGNEYVIGSTLLWVYFLVFPEKLPKGDYENSALYRGHILNYTGIQDF
jgi:hypothetical protein